VNQKSRKTDLHKYCPLLFSTLQDVSDVDQRREAVQLDAGQVLAGMVGRAQEEKTFVGGLSRQQCLN
jgi:hypothetical protein